MKATTREQLQKQIIYGACTVLLLTIAVLILVMVFSGSDTPPPSPTEQTTLQTQPQQTTAPTTEPTEASVPQDTTAPQEPDPITDAEDPQSGSSNQGAKVEISQVIPQDSNETKELTFGIDVSKYQGTINWEQVAAAGTDFAMVRIGYRTLVSGKITADTNAKYNMQQAQKYGIKLGAYFFSTAVSVQEAQEEANWVADYISQYSITYPVAYNCEGFLDPQNRQYSLTKTQRTDIALAFLKTIQSRGYTPMFYASQSEMEHSAQWEISRIDSLYKVWVAQYPAKAYPQTQSSSYTRNHAMWQYTTNGIVPGIPKNVDMNIAYFGYEGIKDAQNTQKPEDVQPDVEALISFTQVNESVTAKIETNLRSHPSQGAESTVLFTLKNGQVATRIGISNSGWSKLTYNGRICYAVSSYLTTDLTVKPENPTQPDIQTQFTAADEQVTAKSKVNLRSLPSTTREDSKVLFQLTKGQIAKRIGISDNGWSKLEYQGSICYAVSSYLTTDIDGSVDKPDSTQITTRFTETNEQVTAKDVVNLRSMPSTTNENSVVVAQLHNGQIVTRTGINTDVGWSRVVYEGQVLYCISSYLQPAQEPTQEATQEPTQETTQSAEE